jgi:hypothetical protein
MSLFYYDFNQNLTKFRKLSVFILLSTILKFTTFSLLTINPIVKRLPYKVFLFSITMLET